MAFGQGAKNLLVADVFARFDVAQRESKWKPPGKQRFAFADAKNGKPMPFKIVADVPFKLPTAFKSRAGRTGACKWAEPPKPVT